MPFNSLDFAIFLPIVFGIYWLINARNKKWQNLFLLSASYLFYGWWDWRFLFLIGFSSIADYWIGLRLAKATSLWARKVFLVVSLVVNLGLLGFFKYYGFFIESLKDSFSFLGYDLPIRGLNVVLPVGISFYTFQTLSYTIDIYRRKIQPHRGLVDFLAFVSFFPQLVAGPIERASNLLPQFKQERTFDPLQATDGLRQILWGLFKKVAVADNCAVIANRVFEDPNAYPGSVLALGTVFFAIQIYCDFSGYSDIAIGTARLFGFNLMQNFAFPYFSRDIAEFWRRWHISLSTWFRDYVYIPLGGNRGSSFVLYRNIVIVFLLSGFWHGANWTFLIWGALHAVFFLPLVISGVHKYHNNDVSQGRILVSIPDALKIFGTFALVCFAWIFFRAETLGGAFEYIARMFTTFHRAPGEFLEFIDDCDEPFSLLIFMILVEWFQRCKSHGLDMSSIKYRPIRFCIYYVILILIYRYGTEDQDFIYFQF